jgi:hypothetical protein
MESVSSTLSASQLNPQSPFDPYRDPFDNTRRDTTNSSNDPPESWSSGENNSNSPLGHALDMDGSSHMHLDMNMSGMGTGDGAGGAHEPKKKRFMCPHCTRTFARSGHLQRHERSRIPLLNCLLIY